MAHPTNPPVMPFVRRSLLVNAVFEDLGLCANHGFWFWGPPRIKEGPQDWFVGPYRERKQAVKARKRFLKNLGEGPELRCWSV